MKLNKALQELKKLQDCNPGAHGTVSHGKDSWSYGFTLERSSVDFDLRAGKQLRTYCVDLLNELREVHASDPAWKFSWVPDHPMGHIKVYTDKNSLHIPKYIGFIKVQVEDVKKIDEYTKAFITFNNWLEPNYSASWFTGIGQDSEQKLIWLYVSDDFDLRKVDVPNTICGHKVIVATMTRRLRG